MPPPNDLPVPMLIYVSKVEGGGEGVKGGNEEGGEDDGERKEEEEK